MSEVVQHKSDGLVGIKLTEAATHFYLAHLNKQKGRKGIRLSVKERGCSGFSYVVEDVENPEKNDIVQPLSPDYQLYIDHASYPFVKGMTIDYVRQGLNYKFVFNNPNETGQCGCGESFTVD
jgi:iron-sulfur cluster assembly accessory protein